jgi:hypothetical protein
MLPTSCLPHYVWIPVLPLQFSHPVIVAQSERNICTSDSSASEDTVFGLEDRQTLTLKKEKVSLERDAGEAGQQYVLGPSASLVRYSARIKGRLNCQLLQLVPLCPFSNRICCVARSRCFQVSCHCLESSRYRSGNPSRARSSTATTEDAERKALGHPRMGPKRTDHWTCMLPQNHLLLVYRRHVDGGLVMMEVW